MSRLLQIISEATSPRHTLVTTLGVCVALFIFTAPVQADDDDHESTEGIEELILGDVPYVQEVGEWQFTLSMEHMSDSDEKETELEVEAEVGITETLQVGIEVPFAFIDGQEGDPDESGISDVGIEILWNFFNEDNIVASAAVEVKFPTGDDTKDLGAGLTVVEPKLIAATQVDAFELIGSVAGEFAGDEEALKVAAAAATPLETPLGEITAIAEFSFEGTSESGGDPLYAAPGLTAELTDDIGFVAGFPIGLNDDAADWGATFRIWIELE